MYKNTINSVFMSPSFAVWHSVNVQFIHTVDYEALQSAVVPERSGGFHQMLAVQYLWSRLVQLARPEATQALSSTRRWNVASAQLRVFISDCFCKWLGFVVGLIQYIEGLFPVHSLNILCKDDVMLRLNIQVLQHGHGSKSLRAF